MQAFETTDQKLAQRCRYVQYRGVKTTLMVEGSPIAGVVHSVKEVASSALDRHGRPGAAHRGLIALFVDGRAVGSDILAQRSPDLRRVGHAHGAREAKLIAATFGDRITRDKAVTWINGAIAERSDELRPAGTTDKDIEAWDWACRIMFMLKIRHAIVD
jgi:hypothetical protein